MMNVYRLEQRIERLVAERSIVGLALALVQRDEIVYARGFGTTSVEDGGTAVTPRTLFCVGSISKSFTSTLIMRLVDAGYLDLDVPVVDYLPGFAFSDPVRGRRITLRHVLSHSTGLPSAGKDFGPRDPDALKRFVWEEIPRYGFVADPGQVYLYSNTVIVIAAHVAEVVTGISYERLVDEWVFAPLQMERATFDRTVAMTYPVALAHRRADDGTLRTRHRFTDNVSGNPAGFGIASTLDLAQFATMHLNEGRFGGHEFLSKTAIAEMHRPQIQTYVPGSDAGYGLGLYSGSLNGHRQVSHGGMLESYWCHLSVFPDDGAAVVMQCNQGDDAVLGRLLHDLLTDVLDTPRATRPQPQLSTELDRSRWPMYEGTYLSLGSGLATVTIDQGSLTLERSGSREMLVPDGHGQYRAGWTPVAFKDDGVGSIEFLIIDGDPYRRIILRETYVPQPEIWQIYEGIYEVVEDDVYPIRIRVLDGTLHREQEGEDIACIPLSDTRFVSRAGVLDFNVSARTNEMIMIVGEASHYRRKP